MNHDDFLDNQPPSPDEPNDEFDYRETHMCADCGCVLYAGDPELCENCLVLEDYLDRREAERQEQMPRAGDALWE
jgi:hypothetical protein